MSLTKKYLGYHDERKLPIKRGDVVTLKADILIVDMGRGGYGDPVINAKRRKVRVHQTKAAFDEVTLSHSKTLEVLALFNNSIELNISAQELKEKLSKITSNP